MKVRVVYIKTVEEVIEVDDKYYALTDTGGFDNLPGKEADNLLDGIITEVRHNTEADYHDIHSISTVDGEMMLET